MSYLESEAVCPYYLIDGFGILKCEIGDLSLKDSRMKIDIGYRLCADKFNSCPFKLALDAYYLRREKEEEILRTRKLHEKNRINVFKEEKFEEPEVLDGEQIGLW